MVHYDFFPENYSFILTQIFGETPRIKIIEFFLFISSDKKTIPTSYISQISRILILSKSSVKNVIDALTNEKILIEKKIETHQKYPQRDIRLNTDNLKVKKLMDFYKQLIKIQ